MSFNLMGVNIEKVNNEIIKCFNKGDKYKGKLMIESLMSTDDKLTGLAVNGHVLLVTYKSFLPFDLEALSKNCSRTLEHSIHGLDGIYKSAKEDNEDFQKINILYDTKQDNTNVTVLGNENIKVGVNKDYLKFFNLDNCEIYGTNRSLSAAIKLYDRGEFIGLIMPIKPHKNTWDI